MDQDELVLFRELSPYFGGNDAFRGLNKKGRKKRFKYDWKLMMQPQMDELMQDLNKRKN